MYNLLLDLENEITNNDCCVSSALMKAYIIINQLEIAESYPWVEEELKGYEYINQDKIPEYRRVHGELMSSEDGFGWSFVEFINDEDRKNMCEIKLWKPIGVLQELYKQNIGGAIICLFTDDENKIISEVLEVRVALQFKLKIQSFLLSSIIEHVKMRIFDLLIELKKVIKKENDREYNKNNLEVEKTVNQNINNYYGNVVNGNVSNSPLTVGTVQSIVYGEIDISDDVEKIQKAIEVEKIDEDAKQEASRLLQNAVDMTEQKKSPKIVKGSWEALKSFVYNVGSQAAVKLIVDLIEKMPI